MNILVLTHIYPQPEDEKNSGVTPVVHNFVKEWIKLGHDVKVYHLSNKYPLFLYLLPYRLTKLLDSKFGTVIPSKNQRKSIKTSKDGFEYVRLPQKKVIPKTKLNSRKVDKLTGFIIRSLEVDDFEPDIILGHWENPQLELVPKLNRHFKTARSAITFHGLVYSRQKRYKKWAQKNVNTVDKIFARSMSISEELKSCIYVANKIHYCYSGIDKIFTDNLEDSSNFGTKKNNHYIYIGRLINRKNIIETIKGLQKIHKNHEFVFDIIGDGQYKAEIQKFVKTNQLEKQVNFLGFKSKKFILERLKYASFLIMISPKETFGLVYLEAMSQAVLPIASKDSGMKGIIDNNNGYLINPDADGLYKILQNHAQLSDDQILAMRNNAVMTASKFSHKEIAIDYLNKIIE